VFFPRGKANGMTDQGFTEDDIRQRIASLDAKDVRINSGYSAIQPHLNTIPTFTEADVRQYVLTHHFSSNITYIEEPKLERIEYTTSKAAQNMIQSFISYEEEQMVFLVELSGIFAFFGGPYPGREATFHTLFVVFDARTGNALVSSYKP
jgi:hypothetical protein